MVTTLLSVNPSPGSPGSHLSPVFFTSGQAGGLRNEQPSCWWPRGRVWPLGRGESVSVSSDKFHPRTGAPGSASEPADSGFWFSQMREKQTRERRCPESLSCHLSSRTAWLLLRLVISWQITGATRTCPLSAAWIFRACIWGVHREKSIVWKFGACGCVCYCLSFTVMKMDLSHKV